MFDSAVKKWTPKAAKTLFIAACVQKPLGK